MPVTKKAQPKPRAARKRKRLITPEDLRRIVFVGDTQMSPDGDMVLFTRKQIGDKNNYVLNLWTVPAAGGDPKQFTSGGKDGQGRWSPDGTRIAFVRTVKGSGPQVFVMPAAGGEAIQLTDFPEGTIGAVKWSPDGNQIGATFRETDPDWTEAAAKEREEKGLSLPPRVLDSVWYRLDGDGYFNHQRFHLFVIDAESGARRKVYDKDVLGFFTFDWAPDSRRIAIAGNTDKRAAFRPWKDSIQVLDLKSGKLRKVPGLPDGPKDDVHWSPDGKWLAWAGRAGKDSTYSTENLHLWVCDPVRGGARNLTEKEDYCLMAVGLTDTSEAVFGPTLRWSMDSRSIYLLLGWHGESHLASVPVQGGKVRFLTAGSYDHALGSLSRDGKRMSLTMGSALRLAEVGVADLKGVKVAPERLTDFNRAFLSEIELGTVRSHWVETSDGNRVQTWVLLPPASKRKKRMPAVLEVHGGPHAMYSVGFFHEFQVLAAAGYAVFFSNPRGSKGYGEAHTDAIRGKWGTADWVDIQAVTAFMKRQSYVDPKRLGVMGGSYGGYMTNWVVGHTNEFAGAITDRCVSNLVSMNGSSDFPMVPDLYWKGNFWDRPEHLWEQSPIQYMGNCKTPTLIIHSEGDLRCNIEQSDQVFMLLKTKNVPTRFVRYPRTTSHGMSRGGPPDMRLHRLHQILDWWKKYLG